MSAQTDRELLELAAKALGWRVTCYSERRSTGVVDGGMAVVVADGRAFGWSPLHDDGDALRLAVDLRLHVDHHSSGVTAWVVGRGGGARDFDEDLADPYAATRRAIVRAAAAIAATGQKGE